MSDDRIEEAARLEWEALAALREEREKRVAAEMRLAGQEIGDAAALREAQAEIERLLACPFCGHEWSRHDPEDGECDAHTSELHRFGVCQCGRDLAWMQEKIAKLSTAELLAVSPPADEANDD